MKIRLKSWRTPLVQQHWIHRQEGVERCPACGHFDYTFTVGHINAYLG
jgi:hypothetical protein